MHKAVAGQVSGTAKLQHTENWLLLSNAGSVFAKNPRFYEFLRARTAKPGKKSQNHRFSDNPCGYLAASRSSEYLNNLHANRYRLRGASQVFK
jgi:hypothetical protein